ncbi:Transcription elongation factor spt6, variant 2, partial [Lathyrus oleraceus]
DDTRIHPESYILAQELAKDVYDEDGTGDAYDDDDALEMAIEHVRDRPSYLKNLDVEEYASGNNRQDKIETLYDIKRELIQGFQDWRKQYEEPSPDEEFYMISGETEETLAEGKMVQVTVRRVQAQRAICGLESGMTGILMKEDYADDLRDIIELSDRLHEGDMLTCKIKSIQKNRYQVFLVCKESEMRSDRLHHNHNFDPYYHEDRSSLPNEQDKIRKERERSKKHFKPRMIVHPRFQNITTDEAIEFLSDKDPGESIFRPNSKGPSYLTLTLKIHDGVYAHKEIIEGGKELKDITSLLRIGKTLKIGEDTFEDLDEVMDRYVDPLVTHLRAMLNYRKFRTGLKTEVDELLKTEKEENPMRIVYSFGICHEHPGTFVLTYIRSTNPHHEYIGLYPKGFRFRKKMFEDIDRLVAYFQRHIDDPQNDSAPSIRSVAAMVPMRSPSTGGSSGASGA